MSLTPPLATSDVEVPEKIIIDSLQLQHQQHQQQQQRRRTVSPSPTRMSPVSSCASATEGKTTPNPQQFCLRWNNYQKNLMNVFDELLQNESFVDVTLACDGNSIKAHKMVLSACSPYFQSLFFENPCQHPTIIMRDVKWPELKAAVEFMYKGEINVSQEQIEPLIRVAEMLKIRGLTDVNAADTDFVAAPAPVPRNRSNSTTRHNRNSSPTTTTTTAIELPDIIAMKKQRLSVRSDWDMLQQPDLREKMLSSGLRYQKKRRSMGSSGSGSIGGSIVGDKRKATSPLHGPSTTDDDAVAPPSILSRSLTGRSATTPLSTPPFGVGMSALDEPVAPFMKDYSQTDEDEIKPGIVEMIREEEKAKFMEDAHAWLSSSAGASIADSYQYQLQSLWQKCWNMNPTLVHPQRFRERGPLKSWRAETMADAINSVLKDGLTLSQAAKKYDIPYPTFVLYANRVHNLLGPSQDDGQDLRPKGRGRPQRILLGAWPDDHIKEVVKLVVFRDGKDMKEEPGIPIAPYGQYSPVFPNADGLMAFPSLSGGGSSNNPMDPKLRHMDKASSPPTLHMNGSSSFNWASTLNGLRHPEAYAASSKCSS